MNQTTAGQLYNNHVKEALQSGKPIELSMRDFLPKKKSNSKKVIHKKVDHNELNMTIEEVLSYCQNLFNIYHTEQKEANKQGNKVEEFENWSQSQPYEILICKITGKEYVCNLPR